MGVMINSAMTNSEWYTYNSLCHHGTCMLKASPTCILECTAELKDIIQTTVSGIPTTLFVTMGLVCSKPVLLAYLNVQLN